MTHRHAPQQHRPLSRRVSRVIRVDGVDFDGPCRIEIQRAEWLNASTSRYPVLWSARRAGLLGWDAFDDLRSAIACAAYVKAGTRPRWLAAALRDTRERRRWKR